MESNTYVQEEISEVLDADEWKLITDTINAYMLSEAVYAACELDVFEKIEQLDSPNLQNIAASSGMTEYCCDILLMSLCASNLIIKDKNTGLYRNHSAARKALRTGVKNTFIPFVRFNHQVQQKGMFSFLDALKSGENRGLNFLPGEKKTLYARLAQTPGMTELFHKGMAAYTHFGPKIVTFKEATYCKQLLDIGGGDGSLSYKFLSENPSLEGAIVMDIDSVCQIGKKLHHHVNKLQFVSDDIFSGHWNFGQDGILFSHILEIFSLAKMKALYKKAYAALPKQGRIFVWTLIENESDIGSLQAAKSSAYFLTMASGEGKTYSKKTHFEICESIGFKIETVYDRSEYDHLGFVAIKE